jgi:predicted ATPase/tetratricopeptide (TPR) repeat protein
MAGLLSWSGYGMLTAGASVQSTPDRAAPLARWEGHHPLELIGPPGIGKSALARRWAEGRDVVWVSAEGVASAGALVHLVAVQLGVDDDAHALGALATRKPAAVVFDDAEQAAGGLRELQGRWPAGVGMLVTSRGRVGLRGAEVLDVGPMDHEASVAMFVQRAQAARRGFDPSAHEEAIDALCVELDGLPLAIELAAARVRTLTPEQILERLSLDQLRDKRRDGRHRSLRQALEGSTDGLSPEGRAAFARAAAFQHTFTLDAFEACAIGDVDDLEELVDAGLVHPEAGGRFRMLAPVRAYASELGQGEQAHERVLDWVVARAAHHDPFDDQGFWEAWRLELETAILRGGARGAAAAVALSRREEQMGPIGLQLARLARLGDLEGLPADLQSQLHRSVAVEAIVRNDYTLARARAERALELAEGPVVRAEALTTLGQIQSDLRDRDAPMELLAEALEHAGNEPVVRAKALLVRSVAHQRLGQAEEGARDARAAVDAVAGGRNPDLEALGLAFLADAERRLGRAADERLARLDRADELPVRSAKFRALVAVKRAQALADAGRPAEAIDALEAPARRMEQAGDALFSLGHRLLQVAYALCARQLDRAEQRLRQVPDDLEHYAGHLVTLRRAQVLHALGHLDDARGNYQAVLALEGDGYRPLRAEAGAFLAAIDGGEADGLLGGVIERAHDGPELRAWVDAQGRWEARLLATLVQPPVTVSRSGKWFSVGSQRVELGRKTVLIRVLAGLAERTRRPIPLDEVIAFGWPGERPKGNSGRARVHVAVSTLRKLGLQGALWTTPGDELAYVLDAEVSDDG